MACWKTVRLIIWPILRTVSCQVENGGKLWWNLVDSRDLPNSARVVESTNHDFPSLGWKIAIGSLSTSALAALKIRLTASLEYCLEGSLEDTSRGGRFPIYFLYIL